MGPGLVRATAKTPGLVQAGIDHRPLVLGGEDRPQDEGLLQKEEGGDAVLVHVAQLTEDTTRRFWWPLNRRRGGDCLCRGLEWDSSCGATH